MLYFYHTEKESFLQARNAIVSGNAVISSDAVISGNAIVSGDITIKEIKMLKGNNMRTIAELAAIYEAGKAATISIDDRTAFKSYVDILYEELLFTKRINILFVDTQPYKNLTQLRHDYLAGCIQVSRLNNKPVSRLMNFTTNLKFRAIHDYHHVYIDAEFTLEGEYKTWEHAITRTTNDRLKWILYSEIVLQSAYAIHNKKFGEQKVVLVKGE